MTQFMLYTLEPDSVKLTLPTDYTFPLPDPPKRANSLI
jgi:hypothetical protein